MGLSAVSGFARTSSMSDKKKHWSLLSSREIFKTPFIRVRAESLELPNKKVIPNYYIVDCVDWVNIVALTPRQELVLVKQYRHPVSHVTLEIPGGAVDPRTTETPEEAARRELIEETGFVPREMRLLIEHHPNPALQSNRIYSYLALDCEPLQAQNLDEFEDIEVVLEPLSRLSEMIDGGEIKHSLALTALMLAQTVLKK